MRIYIRLKNHGSYEGQELLFATTDRERAFFMKDEDKSEEYFFSGSGQELHVCEDEKVIEIYEWLGDVKGFQPHWRLS